MLTYIHAMCTAIPSVHVYNSGPRIHVCDSVLVMLGNISVNLMPSHNCVCIESVIARLSIVYTLHETGFQGGPYNYIHLLNRC